MSAIVCNLLVVTIVWWVGYGFGYYIGRTHGNQATQHLNLQFGAKP